LNKKQTSFW